ncbi:T9SS type B sorting domain-containing protein [Yeosuana sp. AK3]
MRHFTVFKIAVFVAFLFSQIIKAQIVIGTPNLGFSQACASSTFNTYNVTFSFSPETALLASNQFIIELSDATGSFANATTIYTTNPGAVTVSPATLNFSIPTTTIGESFRIRIKSTAPVATSSSSAVFAAYFKLQDTPFTINNLISTGIYCAGGSYLLTIDNPGFGSNDSPLQYPSLTFNWYKETSATTSVFVSKGPTLSVNEPGTYFVETDYGSCTSNSFSNRVTVSESSSGTAASISSSLGNPYCSNDGETTLSTINALGYQWFKDGVAISGATNQMYNTNESANFSVAINLGECSTNASINLVSTGFNSSIDVEDINQLESGETLIATVTTDAMNPEFKWFLNAIEISGATQNFYEISQTGQYRVVINQTTGCIASNEFLFTVSEPSPDVSNIPNLISPNGDGINDTWVIPQAYVSGTNTEVMIISAQGNLVLKTNDYQNNWPENDLGFKDVNPVYYYIITTQNNKTLKGSITVIK